MLFDAHPQADEGALSRLRATLVSGETLAQIAQALDLGEHLRLGPGELKSGGFRRASILADALEAILGAMFLDSGFDAAAAVVTRLMAPRLSALPAADLLKDPKTRLQEALQARGLALPIYTLTAVAGDAHAQSFTVTCEVPVFELAAVGEGASRRRAEQLAAAKLLELLPAGLLPAAANSPHGVSPHERAGISRRPCGHRRPAQCRQVDAGQCAGGPQDNHRHRETADDSPSDLGGGESTGGAVGAGRYAGIARIHSSRHESVHEPRRHFFLPGRRRHSVRGRGNAFHG